MVGSPKMERSSKAIVACASKLVEDGTCDLHGRRMSYCYYNTMEDNWLKECIWWKKGIIYQIYPRSFKDSNGDGVGDLQGIISKLDYIQSLNVSCVWLSPIYPSPMKDCGYDIKDYVNIDPVFGTLDDFDELLRGCHDRGLRLIMDLVPNHTSDEHPFFIQSRDGGRDGPMRDWYIWRDPSPDGGPPNNWKSFFGGSAWEFDQKSGQYYLHQFVREQPELNYRNSAVLEWLKSVIRFWLEKGVDGFRVDVIWLMLKDLEFRDEEINHEWDGKHPHEQLKRMYSGNIEGIHDVIREMRSVFEEFDDRVMIGEIYLPYEELVKYYGTELDECHLPFNFKLITIPWEAVKVRHFVNEYEAMLPKGCWPNWVIGNHDQHRVATRAGPKQAGVANMLLLTLRGTPTTYNGEEIGMENGDVPFELMQDPQGLNQPELAHLLSRDFERTPMQWSDEPNAGFGPKDSKPWLPVSSTYKTVNVERQNKDPSSLLRLYRVLTSLRSREPSLSCGHFRSLMTGKEEIDHNVFIYIRQAHEVHHPHHISTRFRRNRQPPVSRVQALMQLEEYSDQESDDDDVKQYAKRSMRYPDAFLVLLNFSDKSFEATDLFSAIKEAFCSPTEHLPRKQELSKEALLEVSTHNLPPLDHKSLRGFKTVDLHKLDIGANEGMILRLREV